jgi:hypothetical protein
VGFQDGHHVRKRGLSCDEHFLGHDRSGIVKRSGIRDVFSTGLMP